MRGSFLADGHRADVPHRLPQLPGLDGLRALSVLAVLLYHADLEAVRGGFLGVEVFFVLSGFLITSLLLLEFQRTGGIDLKRFWLRRARRLLPALYLFLIGAFAFAWTLAPDALPRLRSELWAALLYVTNWQLALQQLSYFESLQRPSLLIHLWSLAVEEQFYVLWPLLLLGGLRRLGPGPTFRLMVAGIVVTTLAMALQYDAGRDADNSAIYMRTDTRAAGLLVGAALAWLWRPWLPGVDPSARLRRTLDVAGVFALGGLLLLFSRIDGQGPLLYRGGFLLTSTCTAVVLAALVTPGSRLAAPLEAPVLRWIGLRSYALYLWHWPVFQVTRPRLDVLLDPLPLFALRLFVSLVLADLSYRWVENPIRQRRFVAALKALPSRLRAPRELAGVLATSAGLGVALLLLAAPQLSLHPRGVSADAGWIGFSEARPARYERVAVVGDSIVVNSREALASLAPRVDVRAGSGRRWSQVVEVTQELATDPSVQAAVIHLGTNGSVDEALIDDVLRPLAHLDRVVLVTARIPARWEKANNAVIRQAAARHPNVLVADWNALSDEQIGWFQPDGVHLSLRGLRAYIALLDGVLNG